MTNVIGNIVFLTISSNQHKKALVFKRALKKRVNKPNWIMIDGKNLHMIPSPLEREKQEEEGQEGQKQLKKTLNAHLNDPCILLIKI